MRAVPVVRVLVVAAVVLGSIPAAGPAQGTAPGGAGSVSLPSVTRLDEQPAFRLPVPGPPDVVQPFRAPSHRYGPGHRGADLRAEPGTVVRAAGAGTVVFAGRLVDRGVVSVEHASGLRTTYEPVNATVRAGSFVALGEVLGTVEPGHAGCAPVSCLHWGARWGQDTYVDPMSLLQPLRVRLWPWDG